MDDVRLATEDHARMSGEAAALEHELQGADEQRLSAARHLGEHARLGARLDLRVREHGAQGS